MNKTCPNIFEVPPECHIKSIANPFVWQDIVGTVCVFIAGVFAAGAGIGGGGLYVPIFIALQWQKRAIERSLASIAGLTMSVFIRVYSKVDIETVTVIQPVIMLGAVIGKEINRMMSLELVYVGLFVLLSFVSGRTWYKLCRRKDTSSHIDIPSSHRIRHWVAIWCCWVVVLLIAFFIRQYTTLKILYLFPCAMLWGFGIYFHRKSIPWTAGNIYWAPVCFAVAGCLAAMFGIGGGMVTSPMLLEIGYASIAASKITITMSTLTALSVAIQFLIDEPSAWDYFCWYFCWAFIAGTLGHYIFKKRQSRFILKLLAIVITVATFMVFLLMVDWI